MGSLCSKTTRIPTQCVDDRDGLNAVVVCGDQTFPMSFRTGTRKWTGSSGQQGLYSSVEVLQFPRYGNESPTISWEPPQTDGNSLVSLEEDGGEDYWDQPSAEMEDQNRPKQSDHQINVLYEDLEKKGLVPSAVSSTNDDDIQRECLH